MNNYCIYMKKRKNKPFCKLLNKEISFSCCQECDNKEYKTRKNVKIRHKKSTIFVKSSTFYKKNAQNNRKTVQNSLQSSAETLHKNDIKISNSNQIKKKSTLKKKSPLSSGKMKAKSNKLAKLERKRYSVFTDDLAVCIICGMPKQHLHEVIYGKNRINSIKYNFVIPLCVIHHTGKDGIHFNKELDLYYKRLCQIYFENNIGNRIEFIKIFGRSYL